MRHIDGRMAVDKDIISAWEELFKRDEIKVRPMARSPSVPLVSAVALGTATRPEYFSFSALFQSSICYFAQQHSSYDENLRTRHNDLFHTLQR